MNIKDNTKMQEGISFLNLIENNKILVPKIQRDYAQGRLDVKVTEIRDNFLTSIFEVLTAKDSTPMLLDFIYGSTQNNLFTPLDGQQRLTTLFLLHWYFIPKSKMSLLLKNDGNSCYSLFSYETRISSKDFCNALVTYSCTDLKSLLNHENATNSYNKHLSDIIINQSWFLWSWRKDPTVKAMLVMLDEIDARFKNIGKEAQNDIWEQLEQGKIIFHLLPLEQFALTDELYVKMNARGKELSKFDIFKSTLEEQMRLNNVNEKIQDEWRKNVDSNWIDIFWNKLAKPRLNKAAILDEEIVYVKSVEKGYLRFFRRMIVFHLFINDNCLECDWNNAYIKRYVPFEYDLLEKQTFSEAESQNKFILNNIRDYSVRNDVLLLMPLLTKAKFFSDAFFILILNFFKSFVYTTANLKHDGTELMENISFESKKNLFDSFISEGIDYDTRIQFFAAMQFFEFNSAQDVSEKMELKLEFNSWMRIVRNLTIGSNIFLDSSKQFGETLQIFKTWAKEIYSIGNNNISLSFISSLTSKSAAPKGRYAPIQFDEEITKANIIVHSDKELSTKWNNIIRRIEEHKYFTGQIGFLLEWSKTDNTYDYDKFNDYVKKIEEIFSENGLNNKYCENHLFRNALMCISEWYLLSDYFINYKDKDRDLSWKSYLRNTHKRENVRILLDDWNFQTNSFTDFCNQKIQSAKDNIKDWRLYFLLNPSLYGYLQHNRISFWKDSQDICLLSKTKWSSRHIELLLYYLCLKYNGHLYCESMNYEDPMSVKFISNSLENKFFLFYIPLLKDGNWEYGKYLIKCDFDPIVDTFTKDAKSNSWEMEVSFDRRDTIDSILSNLMLK